MMGQDEKAKPEEAETVELATTRVSLQAEADTPEMFLANLSEVLKASDGVDTELAAVLTDYLLKVKPQANAVADAKSTIVAIATNRAAPAEDNASG